MGVWSYLCKGLKTVVVGSAKHGDDVARSAERLAESSAERAAKAELKAERVARNAKKMFAENPEVAEDYVKMAMKEASGKRPFTWGGFWDNSSKVAASAMRLGVLGVGATGAYKIYNSEYGAAGFVAKGVLGSKGVEKVSNAVDSVAEKGKQVVSGVSNPSPSYNQGVGMVPVSNGNSFFDGTGNLMGSINQNGAVNTAGNFMGNLFSGNVSGASLAGLLASAWLLMGRFGWMGRMAGALFGSMILGNNVGNNQQMAQANGLGYSQNNALSPSVSQNYAETMANREQQQQQVMQTV